MTIAIPVFGLILYLGKHGKNRKRENVSIKDIRKDIRYVIGIILVSFLMYNTLVLNLEYIVGIVAVLRIYNTCNSICI